MKMTDIVYRYYGDFDLINEKWNEDYESILIRPRMIKNIKDAVWQRKHPKKKDILQSFGKKTKTTRISLILTRIWEMNWLLSSLTTVIAVYL